MAEFTRAQLMESLGVSYSTIRKYQKDFQQFFEAAPGRKSPGKPNVYGEHDARVFATIHYLREAGVSYEQMHKGELKRALREGVVEFEPERRERHQGGDEQQQGVMVPLEQFAQVVGKLQATSDELERILAERDALQERLLDAEKRAVRGEDSERLRAERDALRRLLDAEKSKTWWDKMRGK